MEGEEWDSEDEGEEGKLEREVGSVLDGEEAEATDVVEAEGTTDEGEDGAEAVGPTTCRDPETWTTHV